jgi:hypothetical protein
MPVGIHDVCVHVKYRNGYVLIDTIDRIRVSPACCEETFGGDSGGGQISGPNGGQITGKLPGEIVIGIPGKSAYEYAVDGGYTGSEAAFAAKLAEDYTEAFGLLVSILRSAQYGEDKTSDINMLAKLLGVEAGDDPVTPKLEAPVIRLVTDDVPDEPVIPDGNTPAILGIAILGRTILGDSGDIPVFPKLAAPVIRLETTAEPEEPTVKKLTTPEIYLEIINPEVVKLAAPEIELVEV